MGKDYFVMPEPLFTEVPKVMSLADPTRKMSKSYGDKHYVNVFADDKRIRKQVRSAVTDTGENTGDGMSPGVENLFTLLRASGEKEAYESLLDDYRQGSLRYVDLKDAVAHALIGLSREFRERRADLIANKKEIKDRVKHSSAEIRKRAQETVSEVKELAGLMNVRY